MEIEMDRLYSVNEVMQILGVNDRKVLYRLIATGKLEGSHITSRLIVVRGKDILKMYENGKKDLQ